MSLNYNLAAIENYKALLVKVVDEDMGNVRYATAEDPPEKVYEQVNYVTRDLIFLLMPLAIGEITEKNWPEVYRRMCLYEFYHGRIWKNVVLGPDIVKRHVGLKVNVATSPKAWNAVLKEWEAGFLTEQRKAGEALTPWGFGMPRILVKSEGSE